jgi:Protein of unknown function (DUF1194)
MEFCRTTGKLAVLVSIRRNWRLKTMLRKHFRWHSLQLGSALLMAGLAFPAAAATAGPQQVDLKLVLATDVSRSIDNSELLVEREGTANAFLDPDVIKAITSGGLGQIAVAAFDFSSPEFDKLTADWHIIKDRASATAFAEILRRTPRSLGRRTSVSGALEFGSLLIEASEKNITAMRKVIDVSGDGPNNDGNSMTEVHNKIIAQGIVVNGLPVMDDQANGYYPDLDKYYAACVAGGRGSFVVVVHSYKDFSAAMRHKLILEISQNNVPLKQANANLSRKPFLLRTAAQVQTPLPTPQILRPGKNEFSDHCDIGGGGFGGFGRRFNRF